MNINRWRNRLWLVVIVTILSTAICYTLYTSYQAEVYAHHSRMRVRGQTLLDALKAGILAQGRIGRYRGDRLTIILEELARSRDVIAITLRDPDGNLVASGGQSDALTDATRDIQQESLRLKIVDHFDFSAQCGQGGGFGRPSKENTEGSFIFQSGSYELSALLDLTEMNRAIHHERVQLWFYAGVVCVASALGVLTFLLLLKRKALGVELANACEHARQEEKAARLGAGLAHETKNPLGIVRGLAQAIATCPNVCCTSTCCTIKKHAKDIVDEVDRVIGGINSFLELSRPPEAQPVCINLDAFLADFLPLAQMDATAAKVTILCAPCGYSVMADENLLRRALLNLILNGLRASKPDQSIRVTARRNGGTLSLTVADEGCGISPEDLPRVTEPYFTQFPGGSGLGLPIVERIASAHGWALRIESVLNQGTKSSLVGLSIVEPS